MTRTLFKSDADLKKDILSELEYEPDVKATDIGVLVKDSTVTLTGFASSYAEKTGAVRAAKRVAGVNAIADDIQIQFPGSLYLNDGDIAAAAATHIKWNLAVPSDSVQATVSNGWVTLDGEVEWWFQKNAAESAVKYVAGVKGITNLVKIRPHPAPPAIKAAIKAAIEAAFKRNALLDAGKIEVTTSGSEVTLTGKVHTFASRDEAERAAYSAPGVLWVDNQLEVKWAWLD